MPDYRLLLGFANGDRRVFERQALLGQRGLCRLEGRIVVSFRAREL